jgi:hypothetical protein
MEHRFDAKLRGEEKKDFHQMRRKKVHSSSNLPYCSRLMWMVKDESLDRMHNRVIFPYPSKCAPDYGCALPRSYFSAQKPRSPSRKRKTQIAASKTDPEWRARISLSVVHTLAV